MTELIINDTECKNCMELLYNRLLNSLKLEGWNEGSFISMNVKKSKEEAIIKDDFYRATRFIQSAINSSTLGSCVKGILLSEIFHSSHLYCMCFLVKM